MRLFSRPRSRSFGLPAALAMIATGVFALDGCSDSTSPWPSRGPVDSVLVVAEPLSDSIVNRVPGQTRQLTAAPIDAQGMWVDVPVTWSSSNDQVASVSSTGLVTFHNPGTATISAAAGGRTGTIEVGTRWPVASFTLAPLDTSIRMEGAFDMRTELRDQHGNVLPGRTVTWTSSNVAVATVSSAGRVVGLTEGTTTITGTSEGVMTSTQVTVAGLPEVATVTVTPASPFVGTGQVVQMTATARAGSGNTITGYPVTWTSSDHDVATVSSTGVMTVHAAGSVTIRAEVEGVTGATTVTAAPTLIAGQPQTAPSIASGGDFWWAVIVPAGLSEFTIDFTGATSGDPDLYVYAPGATATTCASFNDGPVERCVIENPAAGTWRIRANAWSGAPAVNGLTVVMTQP